MPTTSRTTTLFALGLLLTSAACDDGPGNPLPIGPGADDAQGVLVLNSSGQTIAAFAVGDSIETDGAPIDLGGAFDGVSVGATETHAVTTVSEFGGSRILFADLETGAVTATEFPEPEAETANPSRAAFDAAGAAWVAGRRSNAIYTAVPGEATASRVASDVGAFVEAVLPIGMELAAVDANVDDDGGTYAPLGPSRVFVLDGSTGSVLDTIQLPAGAVNAIDAVVVGDRLVVLLGGTLDPLTFAPAGDGGLVTVDLTARAAGPFHPLDGNGVAIEAGADGIVYATSTNDFVETDLVSFDPVADGFVAGPSGPLDPRTPGGARIECWAATALEDGRLLCVTFRVAESGRLYLLDANGDGLDQRSSGFGSTDLRLR